MLLECTLEGIQKLCKDSHTHPPPPLCPSAGLEVRVREEELRFLPPQPHEGWGHKEWVQDQFAVPAAVTWGPRKENMSPHSH